MSWSAFMETKHIGSGIHRPYADFIGELADSIDNILVVDPPFSRFTKSLIDRDFILIRGNQVSILCLSDEATHRFPIRDSPNWNEFISITETAFIAHFPGVEIDVTRILNSALDKTLIEKHGITNPIVIAFPSCFGFTPEDIEKRNKIVAQAAAMILDKDRHRFQLFIEMQKPKNIFLSHKTPDKTLVREIAATLKAAQLSPWLDEENMKAGANLERSLRQGFTDSCAAVFFVTPRFVDDGYLASEVDYALAEKRSKGERFSIVTLLLPGEDGSYGEVPTLLRTYVWKQIQPIEIVRTILEALPIQLGQPSWRV